MKQFYGQYYYYYSKKKKKNSYSIHQRDVWYTCRSRINFV